MVVFMILWGTLVYCPLCHWVWDGGLLAFVKTGAEGPGLAGGALDFAGGTVVHISSGTSALMLRPVAGETSRVSPGTDAAAQPHVHRLGRRHAVGGLVRLQRRQRAGFR